MSNILPFEDEINSLLIKKDPLCLTKYNEDEYLPIADMLINRIKPTSSVNTIKKILAKSFQNTYGMYGILPDEKYTELAIEIQNVIKTKNFFG